ncbi:MAG: hypothetical protein Q8K78_09980 [Planctomycetaceae bacterium]|nr:hypothetical protein [Planctomycetaceae bacterium]
MPIFDLFSKRGKPLPDVFVYDTLPEKLRVQVVHILKECLYSVAEQNDHVDYFVTSIRKAVLREHGLFKLAERRPESAEQDMVDCILQSNDTGLVLDLIELTLRTLQNDEVESHLEYYNRSPSGEIADEINHRFKESGVGYYFDTHGSILIRVDNTLTHDSAIKPVLQMLSEKRFKSANAEFLQAFDDYKKGDFSDCVVKCCAAFESVLKIICDGKNWPYSHNDTCGPLVTAVVKNGALESMVIEPLKLIGIIRNKKSIAHGAGTADKSVSEALARYCLNLTASSILYVVESTR